jgi:hypothetical protein
MTVIPGLAPRVRKVVANSRTTIQPMALQDVAMTIPTEFEFSGRVSVYFDGALAIEQQAKLVRRFKKLKLSLEVRELKYFLQREVQQR